MLLLLVIAAAVVAVAAATDDRDASGAADCNASGAVDAVVGVGVHLIDQGYMVSNFFNVLKACLSHIHAISYPLLTHTSLFVTVLRSSSNFLPAPHSW